jgi:Flp pilus assembly pilin Flp
LLSFAAAGADLLGAQLQTESGSPPLHTRAATRLSALLTSLVLTVRHPSRERGASLIEYVLLLSLIVLACVAAVTLFGNATSRPYSGAASGLAG